MSNAKSKISAILYSVRSSPLSYPDKLKKIRDIGYRSIQGGFVSELSDAEHKKMLDDLGLDVCCFAHGIEDLQKEPGKYANSCKFYGCDEIMIGTMPTEYRLDYDGYMKGIELVNSVGKELKKAGVYISYHNHAQEFRKFNNGKTGMDLLYENLDFDCVRFLLDTHWIQAGGGDIIVWLNKCKGRMAYLHVKDYRIAPANYNTGIGDTQKQFSQIGDGNLPWSLIIETALGLGIKSFIVEQDFSYDQDPFDCVAESYNALVGFGLN